MVLHLDVTMALLFAENGFVLTVLSLLRVIFKRTFIPRGCKLWLKGCEEWVCSFSSVLKLGVGCRSWVHTPVQPSAEVWWPQGIVPCAGWYPLLCWPTCPEGRSRACRLVPSPCQPPGASCVLVPADPPPQLVPAPNVTVSPGETAILSCRVLGEAPYNLTWVRDWRVLSASTGRVTQLADRSLEVSAIIPSDGGRYQCVASNANGVTRASVWLLVRGEALPAVAVVPVPHTT